MIARYSSRIAWQKIPDEVLIVDLVERVSLGLNPVATLVWPLIESHDLEEISGAVASRFEVDHETARGDVLDFVKTMTDRGLLDPIG